MGALRSASLALRPELKTLTQRLVDRGLEHQVCQLREVYPLRGGEAPAVDGQTYAVCDTRQKSSSDRKPGVVVTHVNGDQAHLTLVGPQSASPAPSPPAAGTVAPFRC